MIDIIKNYKTKDGKEVRIYSVAGGGKYPVHGSVKQDSGFWSDYWFCTSWTDTGFHAEGILTSSDLIEVKSTRWLNVYSCNVFGPYDSRERADEDCKFSSNRIACVEFKEGDGLDFNVMSDHIVNANGGGSND